ncbi:MAG: cell division protein FtsQ/DivIB [Arsenophonus sp.]|nr:MAG: cell division protein FtsQ/DivIB [Arsenophonus sp.]
MGQRQYTNDIEIKKIILNNNINFFNINTKNIIYKIKEIPWIQNVKIYKKWPNIINIYLTEYEPYVKWNNHFFLNIEGHIFTLSNKIKNEFPILYGPNNSHNEVLKMYKFMIQKLKIYNLDIKILKMTNRGSWIVKLTNNIELNIGTKNIKERFDKFISLYPILTNNIKKNIRYIDLRYKNGIAIS